MVATPRPLRAALLALLNLILFSHTSRAAAAESAYDAHQRALAARVIQHGKQPQAALDLLRMARNADEADPALTRALFERIAAQRNLDVQHRIYAARRVAWDLRRTGDVTGSEEAFRALGYLTRFRVVGPFDNEGKRGFDTEHGPEASRSEPVNPDAVFPGRERPVRFRSLPAIAQDGYVRFDAIFRPAQNVCGFAETSFTLEEAEPLTLWLGGGGAVKLYFNGHEVLRDATYRRPHPDRSVALVAGQAGHNRVLVKACAMDQDWGFYLRVGDAQGEARVVGENPEHIEPVDEGATGKPASRPPRSVLAQLEAAAAKPNPSARALEDLARFLWYTSADDPAENRARQLALRAAERGPSAERYLLASTLSRERYEKLRLIQAALRQNPKDARARVAYARLISRGPNPERALPMVESIRGTGIEALQARELQASLLRRWGLEDTALALVRAQREKAPRASGWLRREADILAGRERKDAYLERMRALLAQHYDAVGPRKALLHDALAQGRQVEVLEHLDALRALFPASERRSVYVADVYDALGRSDLELAALKNALEIAPESANLHVRKGRALLRADQAEAAADALRQALALRPQDAETRELLEQIEPAPRRDESYAADQATLLARRLHANGRPATVLQDLTVNTVFENGLGSRFVQFAAQAHDAEGARMLRARSIQFDPETQRVDVRLAKVYRADGRVLEATETYEQPLGEPWYRVYYDTRALVVVFPDLEPGDSVELRYRVDDVAPRNLFADYYGDLHLLAGSEQRRHVEYVLISPSSRSFYFNKPSLKLDHSVKTEGETRIDRFVAEDVPPVVGEPDMPGLTEVLPYLHVSTYKSWDDVAQWWWGLVRDQLYADAELKRVVARLKQEHPEPRALVSAIYGWVVKHTRYVALEFGIHGFLPYRVPQIVRRGFGDCKDKASLIYTMLREAGIEARLVLVRTRQNGAIDGYPASLAVFDHAIAYVPAFDLFLDGTAEHSGSRELPEGDQGVMVLVVGPDSAELRETPVLPAESNLRSRKIAMVLDADGSGRVTVDETIAGVEAAGYRDTYEAEGTQRDRLERQLSGSYPGLSLEQHQFTGLEDLEQDVGLHYRLSAPVLARREAGELRVALTSLSDLLRRQAQVSSRRYPLELGAKPAYREERRVQPPPGYRVAHLPQGGEVDSPFGSLRIRVQAREGVVIAETDFMLHVDRVESEDYPAFRRFIERADALLRQRIAFSSESK